ncbi:Xab2 [Scenedesmus sp. PABB004]|nr:Xab2 [Scenedesmus sp. PABB004]
MHKMPRIWLEYLELVVEMRQITHTRRTFDRALAALPITQHDRVWVLYLRFLGQPGIPVETAVRVYRRYLQLEPSHAEEFVAYLKQKLCELITKHPAQVAKEGIDVDAILRGGIRKYKDEVGRLWAALADFHIRRGAFEVARDVYEEGMAAVATVRDFGLLYDALSHFEESLLAAKLAAGGDDDEPPEAMDTDGVNNGADFLLTDGGDDTDLRLARLEALAARRPALLSAVMLRQNPHNVAEWHKRVKLFAGDPTKQILTFTEAVKTVDHGKALGKPNSLWVAFAKFYEAHGDVPNARVIFGKATQVPFRYVDDLATVWCEWAEMELRHANYATALDVMRRATAVPARPRKLSPDEERQLPVQDRLYRSSKLWAFYADLEESLGTLESACAVYDAMLGLKVATPQIILNYAHMLQEAKHWEASFQVYERGTALFRYPHVADIWAAYLKTFVERYGGTKLERARDMFETAIKDVPPEQAKALYLEYAALEEQHGLARHAMQVYERAIPAVPKEQRLSVVELYVSRATDFFGIAKVREIYEAAIEGEPPGELPPADVRALCVRYAALERKLGEVDRARAIFVHGAHLADPRHAKPYWEAWNEFEVRHGNEDTFREMLRIKRSVAASYAQSHIHTAATIADAAGTGDAGAAAAAAPPAAGGDSMAALEAAALEAAALAAEGTGTRVRGFVSAGVIQQGQDGAAPAADGDGAAPAAAANPEEIDLGGDDDDDDGDEPAGEGEPPEAQVVEKAVPAAVFGSLAGAAAAAGGGAAGGEAAGSEALGALERFKKRRLCLETIAAHAERLVSLAGGPEELMLQLLQLVLAQGKLTPRLAALFADSQHDAVLGALAALNLRETPPLVPDSARQHRLLQQLSAGIRPPPPPPGRGGGGLAHRAVRRRAALQRAPATDTACVRAWPHVSWSRASRKARFQVTRVSSIAADGGAGVRRSTRDGAKRVAARAGAGAAAVARCSARQPAAAAWRPLASHMREGVPREAPKLAQLCLETIAAHAEHLVSLAGVPEELTLQLLQLVLAQGKLTPRLAALFADSQHDAVLGALAALNLRETPPLESRPRAAPARSDAAGGATAAAAMLATLAGPAPVTAVLAGLWNASNDDRGAAPQPAAALAAVAALPGLAHAARAPLAQAQPGPAAPTPAGAAGSPRGAGAAAPRAAGYSTDAYWNGRYAEKSTHFDWFYNYGALAGLIGATCDAGAGPVLHVGCGNSGLSEGMVQDGYTVVNVDISDVVIAQMRRMHALPGQSWEVADCRSMPQYGDASFGAVLDKGTLDAVLCSSHGAADTAAYLGEVHRLLAPGGVFLLISLGQPGARLAALHAPSAAAAPPPPPYLSPAYAARHADEAAAAAGAAAAAPGAPPAWAWGSVAVYLLPKPSLYLASELSLSARGAPVAAPAPPAPGRAAPPCTDKDSPVAWLGPFAPGAELDAAVAERGLQLREYFTAFVCRKAADAAGAAPAARDAPPPPPPPPPGGAGAPAGDAA